LKHLYIARNACSSLSRPARARGLKQDILDYQRQRQASRPARARGLKLYEIGYRCNRIEGRAPRGRVD